MMSFRKVSEIVKSQAMTEFNRKRTQVIHKAIGKIAKEQGKSFEEVLTNYMNSN